MFTNHNVKSFTMSNGDTVTIETGKLARQADGAVIVKVGKMVILASAVASKEPRPGIDFFPLSVDYQEKFAAAGRIPGSFFKREGRISDYEVLISRLIDRALRPLFPDGYRNDVQILLTLQSSDEQIIPDAYACLAASAALAVSNIPIQEMISEVRVAKINGEYCINPKRAQMADATLDLIIAATQDNIMMVEGEAKQCSEAEVVEALQIAHTAIREQIKAQQELWQMVGSPAKKEVVPAYENIEIKNKIHELAASRLLDVARAASAKHERSDAFSAIKQEVKAAILEANPEILPEDEALIGKYFYKLEKEVVRNMMLDEGRRLDGRNYTTVRPLAMEVDYLPSPHGSALFTRGETQSLSTATLGTPDDELLVESAAESNYSKFFLHYNFPPFSTGETRPQRGPGRREVGHGNLALRSLKQMLPTEDKFPYTLRIISDILESNGSSSMATVCAGSLAMMDAGIPMEKHISGVAMGLISRDSDKKYCILTDILGDEDHLGDMDFKVTGTRDGICAIQMDIKVDGLSMEIMTNALEQARQGRLHILDAMYECMPAHREEFKPQAPRIEMIRIDKEFIGAVIGPGGKVIQEMQKETGTTINIEEVGNEGIVKIFSPNGESIKAAMERIKNIVLVPEVGDVYDSKVVSMQDYGCFVEFLPGKQGLLHISEVAWERLSSLEGVLAEGDIIKVKLSGIDPKTGKFRLSAKELLPKPEGYVEPAPRPRNNDRGDRGNDRGPRNNDRRGGGGYDRRDNNREQAPAPPKHTGPVNTGTTTSNSGISFKPKADGEE
jgi:polyribonucleotide nucleotidyltransferase